MSFLIITFDDDVKGRAIVVGDKEPVKLVRISEDGVARLDTLL